ncbi:MAG: tetratricopeptide repeat protein [Magnetococcales bacterium]|nr:tetratricopeptide repeat protein [Magnetococcales bacterium]
MNAPSAEEVDALYLLFAKGEFAGVERLARELLVRFPDHFTSWQGLGAALQNLGRDAEAVVAWQHALALRPGDVALANDLGILHYNTGVKYIEQNRPQEAVAAFREAVRIRPDLVEAHRNLAILLLRGKRFVEAECALRQVAQLRPDDEEPLRQLGALLHEQTRLKEAEALFRAAMEAHPRNAEWRFALAGILMYQGRFDEGERHYRLALESQPDLVVGWNGFLYALVYHPDQPLAQIVAAHREYDERFVLPLRREWRPHGNTPDPERVLKVGYVSPDFRWHSINGFVEPLLERHDRSRFSLYAYADLEREDEVTARYKGYVDHWIATRSLTDAQLAERIRADAIDILVDLGGHTGGNRLGVFARKPAPVSVTWQYGFTLGVSAIDHHLTDALSAPPGSEPFFLESPWRMATPALVYRPPRGMGEVSALPALENGFVTFGSFARAIRINHRVVRVWSAILHQVANARLMIYSADFRDERMQEEMRDRFAACGIGRERLEIGFTDSPWDKMRAMDIGLDCFPYNSGITVVENLCLGIPAVSLAERITGNGGGALLLRVAGHPEWVACTEEEYVAKAVALAGDLPALVALRAGLRAELEKSALMDEPGFARKVEAAYREMWRGWCEQAVNTAAAALLVESGNRLLDGGRCAEAEAIYRQLVQKHPWYARAWFNLGRLLQGQERVQEAEEAYREAIRLDRHHVVAHSNLGVLLIGRRALVEAEALLRRAIAIDPGYAGAYSNLGVLLHERNRIMEAEAAFREAVRLQPDHIDARNNLANILMLQCRFDEGEACCREALTIRPDSVGVMNNLLFALVYHPDKGLEEIASVYREYDARFVVPLRVEWRTHANARDPERRLRVGYVSPDFRKHSINGFVEPLLERHDRTRFELFAYADLATGEDEVSRRYQGYVDHWLPTRGLSDAALAERIRADGIDILVDLAGQTAHNRLGVFARKPAPVSVTWQYGFTTGVSAIDHLLTDPLDAPPGCEGFYLERPWRLEAPALVYRPEATMGEVTGLPALERGYITFGTLGRSIRINHRVIRTWSQLLHRVAGARLMIYSANYRDESLREALYRQFAACGIDRERLEIGFAAPVWDKLRGMDIGLDCFPYNSGITLVETLYLGIPAISLAERITGNGGGARLLHVVGHPEWIARTEEEYVAKAAALASDLPALVRLRAGLRGAMANSPLMDEPGFARKVEAAYRAMWRQWCAS